MKEIFKNLGGEFALEENLIQEKLSKIKAFLFDWDGVFNDGKKGEGVSSSFSEADSMGTNLLRYSLWRKNQKQALTGIITGARNPSAIQFAQREHFNSVYFKILDKVSALENFCKKHSLQFEEVAYCFDDVNDLGVAEKVGFRTLIRRNTSPILADFMRKNQLFDYHTSQEGGANAIREFAEMFLSFTNQFENVVTSRRNFDEKYQTYFKARQNQVTFIYTEKEGKIIEFLNQ